MIAYKASASHKLLGHVTPSDVFDDSIVCSQSLSLLYQRVLISILPAWKVLLVVNTFYNPGGLAALARLSVFLVMTVCHCVMNVQRLFER